MITMVIISVLLGVPALTCFVIAYRQHNQKGVPWTNAWFYASPAEREKMTDEEKARQFKLSRNVFFGCGIVFVIANAQMLTGWEFLWIVFGIVAVGLCVYGIAASIKRR
ncbi:MAG: hypothetical protein FWB74_07510 [Defluviitaleaceae bacterium]|nr:hypothetical protein [Defluviitaleaceae bacterium]